MIKNKVFKNASWLIVCKVIQALVGLVISSITVRYLGDSNFGIINYASSLVSFVLPVMQLGFNHVLVQQTVSHPEEEGKIYGTAILLSMISSAACMIGIFGFVSIANAGENEKIIVCMLQSIVLLAQAIETIQYWFQSKLLSKYFAITTLVAYFIVSIYKIVLLILKTNVYWFVTVGLFDLFLIDAILLIVYRKNGGQRLSFSWAVAKRMFSKSKHYIISSLMVTFFAQTDKIMINFMLGDAETGWYSAAVSTALTTSFVFSAIIDSMRPSIFARYNDEKRGYEERVVLLYSVVIFASLLQAAIMTVFAKIIIGILYGADFYNAVGALRIVVWYTTFSYIGSVRNVWILAEGKQKYLWVINLSGALFNILFNLIFIPIWGINGAAFASLITQIFTNVVLGYIIRPISYNNKLMLKSLNPKILINAIKNIKNN
ncbi:MAG: flippase [Clostridia bacterium]|nr:flippase [Clostridia bacterium]